MKKTSIFILTLTTMILIAAGSAAARTVDLEVSLSNPYLLADQQQSVFLKVGLTGFELASRADRPPANVAIVLDRSGSMDGEKIRRAKEAALLAVDMLEERDIVSIVTYSDTVSVLIPATRVSDRTFIRRRIESIFAGGSTALFAGVSKGADEVYKFLDQNRVNRVILLSDGLANVGPDSPMALGSLGESLKKTGISVTTIGLGLGYNEDLMVALAKRSDGNHTFVENYNDLVRIFQYEFNDILSVVAQNVEIEITCEAGIIPRKILGREGEIIGNKIYTSLNQLYSNQEKYILIELEVPPHREGQNISAAQVSIRYDNMESKSAEVLSSGAAISFTRQKEQVDETKDRETLVEAAKQIATEKSEKAISLRDEGKVEEAKKVMQESADYLEEQAQELESEELKGMSAESEMDAEALEDDSQWNSNRKRMKAEAYEKQNQQSY